MLENSLDVLETFPITIHVIIHDKMDLEGVGFNMFDITKCEEKAKAREVLSPTSGQIIFYGSSTFTLWLEEDMKRLLKTDNILNLAFGGSMAIEAWHFSERVLFKHTPSALCYYEGDNDAVRSGMSPYDAFRYSRLILDRYSVPVFVVGAKHSPSRKQFIPYFDEYNKLSREYCEKRTNCYYVDTKNVVYKDGVMRRDIFRDDMLHFNDDGNKALACELLKAFATAKKDGFEF